MAASQLLIDSVVDRASTATEDGFECFREGTGHRLQLWGRLPSDWVGNLGLHTYVAGLQVVTGDGIRTARGTWAASFLLDSANPRQGVHQDFLNMARRAPRLIPELPDPRVTIGLRLSSESPGHVYARVAGKDSIGLVANVIRRFATYGLRPRRFILRTRGDEIEDWFWLEPDQTSAASLGPLAALESEWAHPT